MKQSLLEQLRSQSTFLAMQWRSDILDYFVSSFFFISDQSEEPCAISSNGQHTGNIHSIKSSTEMRQMNMRIFILFFEDKLVLYVYLNSQRWQLNTRDSIEI